MPPHHDEAVAAGKMASLSGEQINTIKAWIDQGARNN
jgi:phage terminase Nu1 subunit (DNA packaging protein)